MPSTFGFAPLLRKYRLRLDLTLSRFWKKNGYQPTTMSSMEKGRFPPPMQFEKLLKLACTLGLTDDDAEDFVMRGRLDSGRLPALPLATPGYPDNLVWMLRFSRSHPVVFGKMVAKMRLVPRLEAFIEGHDVGTEGMGPILDDVAKEKSDAG